MKWIRKYKNPDENPDLPTNFKNLEKKNQQTRSRQLLSNVCDKQKIRK
jgi:hypothetical protein